MNLTALNSLTEAERPPPHLPPPDADESKEADFGLLFAQQDADRQAQAMKGIEIPLSASAQAAGEAAAEVTTDVEPNADDPLSKSAPATDDAKTRAANSGVRAEPDVAVGLIRHATDPVANRQPQQDPSAGPTPPTWDKPNSNSAAVPVQIAALQSVSASLVHGLAKSNVPGPDGSPVTSERPDSAAKSMAPDQPVKSQGAGNTTWVQGGVDVSAPGNLAVAHEGRVPTVTPVSSQSAPSSPTSPMSLDFKSPGSETVDSPIKVSGTRPDLPVPAVQPVPTTPEPRINVSEIAVTTPTGPAQLNVALPANTAPTLTTIERHLTGQSAISLPPERMEVVAILNRPADLGPAPAGAEVQILPTHWADSPRQHPRFSADAETMQTTVASAMPPTQSMASVASSQFALMPAVSPAVAQVVSTERSNGTVPISGVERPDEIAWDVRMPVNMANPVNGATTLRPEMPPQVVHQITSAIHRATDNAIEIALNPAELGRVRMTLSASDAGITVSILADRADTVDLMRRNIDDLARSFAELGYEDISFDFNQGGDPTDPKDGADEGTSASLAEADMPDAPIHTTPTAPRLAIAPDGIDMRF